MKIKKISENTYAVLLVKGENILESLLTFHKEIANYNLCKISAIGAITNAKIGYAYLEDEVIKYNWQTYTEEYELITLDGNITMRDNESAVHIHTSISDENNRVIAGHLDNATVSIVCEMFIIIYDYKMDRKFNDKAGLKAWDI